MGASRSGLRPIVRFATKVAGLRFSLKRAEGRITKIRGLKDHPLNKGRLCPKGARAKGLNCR